MRPAIAILLLASVSQAAPPAADLPSLYKHGRWIDLARALQTQKGPALYRGAIAATFNRNHRAERILKSVIRSAPRSDEAYEAYEWLTHIYFRTGRYRTLISNMDARWKAFPDRSETPKEQSALAGFRGLPDQITGKPRAAKLPHDPGEIFIPVAINGRPATYFFDTGAWLNCMSESEATRLGLAIHESGGASLNTGTGVHVGFRTAISPEVVIGGIHYRNVTFAVFPDSQEPWSDLPPGRRGLIGIPLLLGFQAFQWTRNGDLEIGMKSAPPDPAHANLFFDNDNLLVLAELENHRVLATLDTGATTTDLYQPFAQVFPDLLAKRGQKDKTEVRGVGHAETFESVTIPDLTFKLGGSAPTLKPAHVLMHELGNKRTIGNFGMDLFKQGRAFNIDFTSMRFTLEP